MLRLRSGFGLGDSLYLQSVARHFVDNGRPVEVCTAWPDVFRPLAGRVKVSAFRRDGVDRTAHYTGRKNEPGTDQFEDCCINAGISSHVALRLDWKPVNQELVRRVQASGKPVIYVQLPREPMGRRDGYGMELLPDCSVIQRMIDTIGSRAYFVQVGSGPPLHRFSGIDLDLTGRTSVAEAIDVAWAASACIGYVSFVVPLAESLGKPLLLAWSRRGLKSQNNFIRTITPQKILHHKATSAAVVDDAPAEQISEAANALYRQIGPAQAV